MSIPVTGFVDQNGTVRKYDYGSLENVPSDLVKDADLDVVIAVQDSEPTDEKTKLWIKETSGEGIQIPTYEEFLEVKEDVDAFPFTPGTGDYGAVLVNGSMPNSASGKGAVAIGMGVTASGHGSQAFGQRTQAEGLLSAAFGNNTKATGRASFVIGQYNAPDDNPVDTTHGDGARKYTVIVGNGTDDENRSNAMTLDWNGNMVLAGDIVTKNGNVQENQYKAYVTDTASGEIASFLDGADDIPVNDLSVAIEPAQDLHGYDHPWPGGVGKNKIQNTETSSTINGVTFTVNDDGTVIVNGTAAANTTFNINPSISIEAGWILSGSPTGGRLFCSNQQGTIDYARSIDGSESSASQTVSDARVYIQVLAGTTLNNAKFSPMFRASTEADATFAPYSNICPISGWTGANATRCGANWFDLRWFAEKYPQSCSYNESTGELAITNPTATLYNTGISVDIPIDLFNGGFIQWEAMNGTGTNFRFRVIYSDGTMTEQNGTGTTTGWVKYTTQLLAKRVSAIQMNWSNAGTFTIKNLCITQGTTDVPYEPYTADTYSITFPTEAGTVYGGTLDVTNGKLMMDRAMPSLAGATLYRDNGTYKIWRVTSLPNSINVYGGRSICNMTKQFGYVSSTALETKIQFPMAGQFGLFVSIPADFNIADVQVCYELATPIVYDLTPTEVKTLLGTNNIWGDCGDSTVEYRADTKLYIDKKIVALASAMN